jgi:hypothetical protein
MRLACQQRPEPGDDLVHYRAGHVAGVPKDPARVVVRARDDPVEGHHRMDEDVAHHHSAVGIGNRTRAGRPTHRPSRRGRTLAQIDTTLAISRQTGANRNAGANAP